jgi:HEPN domain-containing protein
MSPRIREIAEEWLRRAHSNLARCHLPKTDEVYFEDLCFDAQQAAEKAIKALFVLHGKRFPLTHDLGELIENLESFVSEIPVEVRQSVELNDYAVVTRYPNWGTSVTQDEFARALKLAHGVVDFVDDHFRRLNS